jgi:hypothetical protein
VNFLAKSSQVIDIQDNKIRLSLRGLPFDFAILNIGASELGLTSLFSKI